MALRVARMPACVLRFSGIFLGTKSLVDYPCAREVMEPGAALPQVSGEWTHITVACNH